MRRGILLALVAALALAIGLSTAASAGVGAGANAAAKKKAAKCGAKKKGKKKAGKAAVDGSAAAKKKGKKKASGCKPKAKKKGKAKPKPAPKSATLADGVYTDAGDGLTVTVSGKGTSAEVSGASSTCSGGIGIKVQGPIAPQGSTVKGTGTVSVFGSAGSVKWTLIVTPSTLAYQLDTVWSVQFPDQDPCQDTRSLTGRLSKR